MDYAIHNIRRAARPTACRGRSSSSSLATALSRQSCSRTLSRSGRHSRWSSRPSTKLPRPAPSSNELHTQLTALKVEETTSDYHREKLQERLAKLAGGVAIIKVGALPAPLATATVASRAKALAKTASPLLRTAPETSLL